MAERVVDDDDDDDELLAPLPDDGGEEDTSAEDIAHPFDPNKIRVRPWTPTIYNLMEKLKHGELDLAPEFQRKAGVWDDRRQSRLVESLLIRIPLPAFYLDQLPVEDITAADHYAVVDGVQRLSTLQRFISEKRADKRLHLHGLEFLKPLEGKTFDDLPASLQRRILETQLAANVVEPGTPDDAKLNIFKRINTGGVPLSAQEIRHAMNPGPVRKWLEEMTELPQFKSAVRKKTAESLSTRMADRECVLRFVAFLDDGVARYRTDKPDFDGFMNSTMKRINKLSEGDRARLAERFRRAMDAAHRCLRKHAFRKLTKPNVFNKPLFEATAVALDRRTDEQIQLLSHRREAVLESYARALDDPETLSAISVSTGDVPRVERRFSAVNTVFSEALS